MTTKLARLTARDVIALSSVVCRVRNDASVISDVSVLSQARLHMPTEKVKQKMHM